MNTRILATGLLLAVPAAFAQTDTTTRQASVAERVAHAVTELEPGAVPVAFDAFARGMVVAADGSASPIGAPEREAIAQALLSAPRAALLAHLRTVAVDGNFEDRRAGLMLLAAGGEASDLRLGCDLVLDEEGAADRRLLRELDHVLADIVRRERTGVTTAVDVLRTAELPVRASLLRALGASGTQDAALELLRLVQGEAPTRLVALTELGRLLAAGLGAGDDRFILVLRRLVEHQDPAIAREALLSLGRLGDEPTIPRMIELLDSPHAGLRANAHWALRELTGLPFTADARRWRTWYAQEEAWWAGPAQELLSGLRRGTAREAVAAMKGFADHRLFRHRLAEQVVTLLRSDDPQMVLLACYSLRQLRSKKAAPEVRRLLDHGDEAVRKAAEQTLAALDPDSRSAPRHDPSRRSHRDD